ncbi:uncharacterized protein [Scyliorhinus torazame]|uniref:uncharacterized protein n=1 Tax=Scyliorhinus torazame TaxID=75743 RepID=UPI003B5C46FF
MCKVFTDQERNLCLLSSALNKKFGSEIWPLGGTWNLENCTAAETAIWSRNARAKWKKLITKWQKESDRRHKLSLLMSWRDNARRRGIADYKDRETKDWETLKFECELWDRKDPKNQGGDNTASGVKQVGIVHQIKNQEDPPTTSGMPLFPYLIDTEEEEEEELNPTMPPWPPLPSSTVQQPLSHPPPCNNLAADNLPSAISPIATRTRSKAPTTFLDQPVTSVNQAFQELTISTAPVEEPFPPPPPPANFPIRRLVNPRATDDDDQFIETWQAFKPQELCLIMAHCPSHKTDPEGFTEYLRRTATVYGATPRDQYSLIFSSLPPDLDEKWKRELGDHGTTWDAFKTNNPSDEAQLALMFPALKRALRKPVDISKILDCTPTPKEESPEFFDRFCGIYTLYSVIGVRVPVIYTA